MRNKKNTFKSKQETRLFRNKVDKLFNEYIDKDYDTDSDSPHSLFIQLRNKIRTLIDQEYNRLLIGLKHSLEIDLSNKSYPRRSKRDVLEGRTCEICSEKRAVNFCHIIPREIGGHNSEDNYLFLCPTHHFLFDQARLTRKEFKKISLKEISADALKYFDKVHKKRHRLLWKYDTNKFEGCDCGSEDFRFDVSRDVVYVQICLICKKCKKVWLNLWTETHPITRAAMYVYDNGEALGISKPKLTEKQKEKRRLAGAHKLRTFLNEYLKDHPELDHNQRV